MTEPDPSPDVEHAGDFAGVPDGFDRLWVPHRMVYVGGQDKPKDASAGECPFCRSPRRADDEGLIVRRAEHAYVVMNLYPYSPGHVLVCPYRHVADYTDLTPEEVIEIAVLTRQSMRVIRAVSDPGGFNLGMNQGRIAGAGIQAHLHQHVVPRWAGDLNFMPLIGRTKPVPMLLGDTRALLAAAWDEHAGD
ncbi:MAG TPA: HIT domain-containing protein [Propionibacterium sp.]|jgi:ATP adenylyltransferase|nr:HIT domain-containing protein [Propionibacterium sp.]